MRKFESTSTNWPFINRIVSADFPKRKYLNKSQILGAELAYLPTPPVPTTTIRNSFEDSSTSFGIFDS